VAASEKEEQAGSEQYHEDHMGAIFKKGFSFSGYERDLLSMNLGQGRFLAISGISGVDSISDGRGSVFGDFDNDGDPDIFLTTAQGEAHYLFRNNVGAQNGFVRIDVQGTRAARDAFGTVVRVKTSTGLQTKIKTGGSGFLSHHDSRLLFGLGENDAAEWIEVLWPDRSVQRFENVPAGSAIRVVQGSSDYTLLDEQRFRLVDPLDEEETFLAGLGFARGERFPDLNLTSESGEPLKLHQLLRSDRHTLLNIWATWCTPCAQEMPELQKLYPDLTGAEDHLSDLHHRRSRAGNAVPARRGHRPVDARARRRGPCARDSLRLVPAHRARPARPDLPQGWLSGSDGTRANGRRDGGGTAPGCRLGPDHCDG